jgi:hypothetical protein
MIKINGHKIEHQPKKKLVSYSNKPIESKQK